MLRVREQQLHNIKRELENAESEECMSKRRKSPNNPPFTPQQIHKLRQKIEAFGGEVAAARWFATTPLMATKYEPKEAISKAREAIRSLLVPKVNHNQVARDQLALLMRDLGKPQESKAYRVVGEPVHVEPPLAEPVMVEMPVQETGRAAAAETGIVRVVDGIPFTLPTLTAQGAEQARVRLTDLAEALGYKDKDGLKKLAARNASELADFGTADTVSVVSGFGRVTQEPTFNPDQCIVLGLASKTEVGSKMRVRMLKAYKTLLAMFEQVVTSPAVIDPTSVLLAFMREQAQAQREDSERRDRLLLEGLGKMLGSKQATAEPEPENAEQPTERRPRVKVVSINQAKLGFGDKRERDRFQRLVYQLAKLGHGELTNAEFADLAKSAYISVSERLESDGIAKHAASGLTEFLAEKGLITRACSTVGVMIDEEKRRAWETRKAVN